jgi:glycerol-3-phosphate dehydrogenase
MYDVVIIGAGVIGCSIARELSRYKLNTCVLEKCTDVAMGTTKANSSIIHAGFDAKCGSLKAKLSIKGNLMFDKLSIELDFPFKRNGSLVVCFCEEDLIKLKELEVKGKINGTPGLQIFDKNQVKQISPNLSEKIAAALYAPTGGIVCPYEFTIALAENAFTNGVAFYFDANVDNIDRIDGGYQITTINGEQYSTKVVVNAAGLFADEINNMVSSIKFKITPRKGEYSLFDKNVGGLVEQTVFQLPTNMGKGVLVTKTVDGNLLIGPNAVDGEDKENVDTTVEGTSYILKEALKTLDKIPMSQLITSFAGLRAHLPEDDFLIAEVQNAENFFNVAGIDSPGLSSAPAIGEMVAELVTAKLLPKLNNDFNPIRHSARKFRELNTQERKKLIAENPAYGKIVCRCEMVTEGEIIDAIRKPLGARTLDGVKRRTRAGMGRCQSGFCITRVVKLLAKELNVPQLAITKYGGNSQILLYENKNIK